MGRQRQLLRPDQLAAEKSEEECSLLRDPADDWRAQPQQGGKRDCRGGVPSKKHFPPEAPQGPRHPQRLCRPLPMSPFSLPQTVHGRCIH